MIVRRILLSLALALGLCGLALAHSFHFGMTDISYNERTGSTELVHTYMAHDIDALLQNLYQRRVDLQDPDDEALLRKYVERQFSIKGADGKPLALRWVGVSVTPDSVVVYQEIEATRLPAGARLHDAVLIDFLPEQINTVNLKRDGTPQTLTFDKARLDAPVP